MLDAIETFPMTVQHDGLILAGDWNCDLLRHTTHCDTISRFWERLEVSPLCTLPISTVHTSYIGLMGIIDHFAAPQNVVRAVNAYKVIGDECDASNLSDHIPLGIELGTCNFIRNDLPTERKSRVTFYKASNDDIDHYKYVPCNILDHIQLRSCPPTQTDIENYYSSIVNACILATKHCIPCNDVSHKLRQVAGWIKHCSDLGLTNRFWHSIWVVNGRPHDGVVAQIIRWTRSVYHAEVRRVMREEEESLSHVVDTPNACQQHSSGSLRQRIK